MDELIARQGDMIIDWWMGKLKPLTIEELLAMALEKYL